MITVRAARADELISFFAEPLDWQIAVADGRAIAVGTVIKEGGRYWACLTVKPEAKAHGSALIRSMRRYFRDLGLPVHATAQAPAAAAELARRGFAAHPTSERLMAAIGFEPTDEMRDGMRVWRWAN